MISDWTIYAVEVRCGGEYAGLVCTNCFREHYADEIEEEVTKALEEHAEEYWEDLATWLDEHNVTDLGVLRNLALRNGPVFLTKIVDRAYPDSWDFPAVPLISVEMDCMYGDGNMPCPCDTEGTGDGDPECEECSGSGYTFRCSECYEPLYG